MEAFRVEGLKEPRPEVISICGVGITSSYSPIFVKGLEYCGFAVEYCRQSDTYFIKSN